MLAPLENIDLLSPRELPFVQTVSTDIPKMLILLPTARQLTTLPPLAPVTEPIKPIAPYVFDLTNASAYTSPDGAISLRIPKRWRTFYTKGESIYTFKGYYQGLPIGTMKIVIGDAELLYHQHLKLFIDDRDPKVVLQEYGEIYTSKMRVSTVSQQKVGPLDGYGLYLEPTDLEQKQNEVTKYVIAPISANQIVLIEQRAPLEWWTTSNTAMLFMLKNLQIIQEF